MKKILCLLMVLCVLCGCSSSANATVKNNEGDTEEITIKEIMKCDKENGARFDKLYVGAYIEVVGTVKKIESDVCYNGSTTRMDSIEFSEGFEVRLPHAKYDIADYSKGDKLKVKSNIFSTGINLVLLGTSGKYAGYDNSSLKTTKIEKVD